MYKNYVSYFLRFLLAAVFIISGIGKIINPQPAVLFLYGFIHSPITYFTLETIIIIISVVEILLALLLLFRIKLFVVLPLLGAMILVFTILLGWMYYQNTHVASCGCFGTFDPGMSVGLSIFRNLIIMILIAITYLIESAGIAIQYK
ncbi:MAG TPA: MauE/DoxX family redox-associated membrane protein [Balneolales bacterium]|nr:MauE/DoxX family redox-associated membrane protein [Balneolales bacterium]